jgi:hypothetical protein
MFEGPPWQAQHAAAAAVVAMPFSRIYCRVVACTPCGLHQLFCILVLVVFDYVMPAVHLTGMTAVALRCAPYIEAYSCCLQSHCQQFSIIVGIYMWFRA